MKKLIINNMSFAYDQQSKTFFQNANVAFNSGTMYFVQGENGVGKSTLFSILQGTTPCNAVLTGCVNYNNQTFLIQNNKIDTQLSCHVKTVIQDVNKMVINAMTIQENLQLARIARYPGLMPLDSPVPLSTQLFPIDQSTSVSCLSGGQKQVLAILMALQKPTEILLLDEPTAALDQKNTHMVIKFLDDLAKKMDLIVIIITHDKELTQLYAKNNIVHITKDENEIRSISL